MMETKRRTVSEKVAGVMSQLRSRWDAAELDICDRLPRGTTWAYLNKCDPDAFPLDRYAVAVTGKKDEVADGDDRDDHTEKDS